ncbi:hypothetical protein ZEAMMB73_Zm00001d049644 [Zea mays]|uniref:Late embryogenesis abundant protein n=1 Tax=Zea mays TaxID=4577 RepID=A0A1D6PWT4_MAIZE|nr:hypothetical protein ZEAMMB73_Zm00001d049644 [Zea mays]
MVLAVVVRLGAVAVLVVVLLQPRAPYVAGAPLGAAGSAAMEAALRDSVVPFRVDGEARTQWKVAGIIGVDQWTRLACQLRFLFF